MIFEHELWKEIMLLSKEYFVYLFLYLRPSTDLENLVFHIFLNCHHQLNFAVIFQVADANFWLIPQTGVTFLLLKYSIKLGITYYMMWTTTLKIIRAGLSLKKTLHVWLSHAKTMFYCYGVRFDVKLNIGFCALLTLMCLPPNTISKYYIIQWLSTNGNPTWSCWWIICKRITEHTSWIVVVKLTRHIRFYACDNSMPK